MECVGIFCATLQTFWRHKEWRPYEHEWRLVKFLIAAKYDNWFRISFITNSARSRLIYRRVTRPSYMQEIQCSKTGSGMDDNDWNSSWLPQYSSPFANRLQFDICDQPLFAPVRYCNAFSKVICTLIQFLWNQKSSFTRGTNSHDTTAWGQLQPGHQNVQQKRRQTLRHITAKRTGRYINQTQETAGQLWYYAYTCA